MMMNQKTQTLTIIGLMTAVTCILGPLSITIPISPVPISFTNLAIYFSVILLGLKKGTTSYITYLLIGFIGVPVFSSFTSGPAKLLGPTGGYLIGFIFLALTAGYFVDKFPDKIYMHILGMVIGTIITYALGTGWLAYQANMTFEAALIAGVFPYVPGDIVKIIIATSLGTTIKKHVKRAGYLDSDNKKEIHTMDIKKLSQEIIQGRRLALGEDLSFFSTVNLKELCQGADDIRKALCGDKIELCSIINGKSGRCSEDCKFCAQSAHFDTRIEEYSLLNTNIILADCKKHADKGVHRYSIVTAGRDLNGKDLEMVCDTYKKMKEQCEIHLCASHGLLTEEAFHALKESGVTMYHENIETSKRNFPNICTTHTYEDKINSIKLAQKIGLRVCSGGIIGMGETFDDRLDMAISLAELGIGSIPINVLMPIKGTTYQNMEQLTEEEILRTIAMFRFINPTAKIRLAAGRSLMEDSGRKAFHAGANATITGDLLTTSGNNIDQDKEMLIQLGFDICG